MALTVEETRELYLAGSVQFPACFPALAKICIDAAGVVIQEESDSEPRIALPSLVVVERLHDKFVQRTVLICEVSAVFLPNDAEEVKLDEGAWLVGPQIQDPNQAETRLGNAKQIVQAIANPEALGIVFVRDDARVFSHVGFAAKACEVSTEKRTMAYKNGCCGGFMMNGCCGG